MKLIRIDWIDSTAARNKWEDRSDLEPLKPLICSSVGFLLAETKKYVTLVHSISKTQVLGRLSIPKVCIRKRRTLK